MAFWVSAAEYNVFVPIFRSKLLPFSNCPLDVQTFYKTICWAVVFEFEMRCLPLRGKKKKLVQTVPGLNSSVHLNMLKVRESNMAILKIIFRDGRLPNVT
jgi:hypothetical protein